MLIVVEGPDKAGKTTLINALREKLSQDAEVEVIHRGPIQRHPLDEYVRPVAVALGQADHVLCDRLHIGEAIYGPLMRNENMMPWYVEEWIDLWIRAHSGFLVRVDTPLNVILQRLKSEGDDFLDDDSATLAKIHKAYGAHFAWRMTRASTMKPTAITDVNHLIDLGRSLETMYADMAVHPSYIGSHAPDVLLVGDERSSVAHRRGLVSAFAPYTWSCGAYLMESLAALGKKLKYGLVNANEGEELGLLWTKLRYPRVIALGQQAREALIDSGVPHGHVPHPQWMKRFHFAKQEQYGEAIAAVANEKRDFYVASDFARS